MRMAKSLGTVFMLLALMILPLSALAEEDRAAIIEGAKKEGKLVWYTPTDVDDCNSLFAGFTKKYPFIKTELYRASGVKILSKVMTETRMGKYFFDVIGNAPDRTPMWIENDLIMPYESPERKFYEDKFKDKEGYFTGIYMNTHVITYNTKMVAPADVPRSYEDLLDPKWKGKLAIDIKDHQWYAGQLEIMGQEKGREFFRKLVKQDLNIRSGHSLLNELLVAGEFPVVVNAYAPNAEQHKAEGAPIEWVPVEPVIFHSVAVHLAKKSANPNCGKLFIDYVLSREGQEIIRDKKRIPCRSDVAADPARLKNGFDGKGLKLHPYPYKYIAENYSAVEKEYTNLIKGKSK